MELKLKLRYAGVILLLFLAMIMFDWYKNIDYSYVYDEENDVYINSAEHQSLSARYTLKNNETYKWHSINSIRKTKTSIPFVFDREVISSTKPELLLVPN